MKKKIEKIKSVIKNNKRESIIVGLVITFVLIIGSSTLINNNSEYKTKSSELFELGATSYQSDNMFVKNKTLDDMDTLISDTKSNLNKELESLLNECTELKLDCEVTDNVVTDIENIKNVLQTKLDEVNQKALDLKLDTSKVLNNQEFNYVTKVAEINKIIDTENKRLAEVKKAEEEKKAKELTEQQAQEKELAVTETQTQSSTSTSSGTSDWGSTSTGSGSTSSSSGSSSSTGGGSTSSGSGSSSGGGSTSSGGSYNCAGTMVADQSACEDLINGGGGNTTITTPDLAVCSNPPGGYFCSKDEAYNQGYADPNGVNAKYPDIDGFGMHSSIVNNMEMWQVVYEDYDSGHSYDFYGNQLN